MKSKASYFSVSKPLVVENLRRFWAIPALAFLVYFLSGVFPILMSYSHLNDLSGYIGMSLSNKQPFYLFAHLMFPIMAAVVIFRYLQGVSSVSVMHSMPFTRAKLYNSGFISGLILIAAPILANGLILLAISKPVYQTYSNSSGLAAGSVNLFARADILNWIWISFLIAFVVFAVSVFSGIVTGNSLMHFATAIWFNFLIPALYAVFVAYFSHFLFGFDTSGNWMEYGMKISPFLNIIQSEGSFSAVATIYYIASFLILYGLSGFLYHKRKLEHATDTLAFGFMEPIICYLIAFLGMTLLGFYFQVLGKSELYLYAGFAAGTVIFFIIGQMVVKKTPRIYNLKSLKSFGIYALIAVLFILGLNFDVTGFEKRIPAADKISSVAINGGFDTGNNFNVSYVDGQPFYNGHQSAKGLLLKDPANISAVRELHRSIIGKKAQFKDLSGLYSSGISIAYNPDGTFPLTRRYTVDYSFFKDSPQLRQIYESKEFKDFFAPDSLNYVELTDISISTDLPNKETIDLSGKADMQEFLACLNKDFMAQTFEDMISLKHKYATATVTFTTKDSDLTEPDKLSTASASYKITEHCTNTVQWLSDHGYDSRLTLNPDEVAYIELYHYVQDPNTASRQIEYTNSLPNEVQQKALKIDDPAKIKQLLDTYETQNINFNDYYSGIIVYNGSVQYQDSNPVEFSKDGYSTKSGMITSQFYLNEGNIPGYVLEYFK